MSSEIHHQTDVLSDRPDGEAVLELDDVSKRFGTETVIENLSLSVQEGEILTLLGPSGCGKTTTLRLVAGLDRPDGGEIRLNESAQQTLTAAKVGTLPDRFAIHGNYPNPFNPVTTLRFDLPSDGEVSVAIFDLLGRQVMSLSPTYMQAGVARTLRVDAAALPSGTYLYRVRASFGDRVDIQEGRMLLVK